jgi:hypothetical protein
LQLYAKHSNLSYEKQQQQQFNLYSVGTIPIYFQITRDKEVQRMKMKLYLACDALDLTRKKNQHDNNFVHGS